MDNYRIILLCEDNFDNMMTGIYDAWVLMNKGEDVALYVGEPFDFNLFCEYRYVVTDSLKAEKVALSIEKKISREVYQAVYSAAMHFEPERADVIFRFLQVGYKMGADVLNHLTNPYAMKILELSRKVGNEEQRLRGFIRFTEINGGVLFSKISPKCNILTMVGDHFSNRYPMENWIIYDTNRKTSAIHRAGEGWSLVLNEEIDSAILSQAENQGEYEKLWKVFFETIGIESRKNYRCQRTMLPKWYRNNMIEFGKN